MTKFRMFGIHLDQFAILCEDCKDEVGMNVSLNFKYGDEGKKVAFVAADTFRAGAIAQLAQWGERLDIPVIKGIENGDPSAAIVDGCRYAKENNIDVLICDTAGRLQNKAGLMRELAKMNRVSSR